MGKDTEYDFIRGSGNDRELEKYQKCFSENGTQKSLQLLKWFHQKNLPAIQSIYYAVEDESRQIAAIYTYLPVLLKCLDEVVVAMQSFDTLTDEKHRGKRLFIKLASKLEAEERAKNAALVFGFPNENSVHGFVKKLGFTYFGEVPFLIKPLRISYFFKKIFKRADDDENFNYKIEIPANIPIKNNGEIRSISFFGEDYDALWEKASAKIKIGVNRNAKYMNWRFVEKPEENYLRFGYYKDGELKAIVVFTLKKKHGGKIGYLMELLFDPEDEKAGKQLLDFSSKILKKNNADVILAWCFPHSFNYFCHRKNGFYPFPEKLRPQKLGMIVKNLNSRQADDIYNVKNWHFSYSDSDTV